MFKLVRGAGANCIAHQANTVVAEIISIILERDQEVVNVADHNDQDLLVINDHADVISSYRASWAS